MAHLDDVRPNDEQRHQSNSGVSSIVRTREVDMILATPQEQVDSQRVAE